MSETSGVNQRALIYNPFKVLKGIKRILCNPRKSLRVIRYVLSNPSKLLVEKYDSVIDNALYGNTRQFFEDEVLNILTVEEYLLQHNINISQEDVSIPIRHSTVYSLTVLETYVICMLAKGMDAKNIFEIGTFEGRTTVNLACNVGEYTTVYTLDVPQDRSRHDCGEYIREREDLQCKIVQLYGDSTQFDFSPFYNLIDLIFIDGGHGYENVLSDSENAVRCVKSGGFIVWHDFDITHLASSTATLEVCNRWALQLCRIDSTRIAVVRIV